MLLCLLLAAVVGLAYLNTMVCGFVADDWARIVEEEHVRRVSSALRFFDPYFWRQEAPASGVAYRPLRPVVSALDYVMWGLDPTGFHLTNVLLHLAVVLLAFGVLQQLGLDERLAFLAAAIFGLHAAGVEATAWVKNRTILCAAAFLLLVIALGCLRGRWWLASIAFALALLSHEQTAVGALWAVVILATRPTAQGVGRTSPLWGVFFVYFGARTLATAGPPTAPILTGGSTIALVTKTLGTYANISILPVGLNLERPLMSAASAAFGVVLLLVVAVASLRRPEHRAALGWGFLILLAPASNILKVNPSFGRLIAEQRLYLPLIPLCALAVTLLRGRVKCVLLLLLLTVSAARVTNRAFDWRSDLTIYSDAVAKSPTDFKARYNLGDAFAEEHRLKAALREYERSLELAPTHGGTRCRYAQVLIWLGRDKEAVAQLKQVLRQEPPSRAAPFARKLLQELATE